MKVALLVKNLYVEGKTVESENVPIVNNVSFQVEPGQITALIGESGAGKSTIALAIMGYTQPGCRIKGGRIMLGDIDILSLNNEQRQKLRGTKISYVAQSAGAAFNPSLRIGQQVIESVVVHNTMEEKAAKMRSFELFRLLDLPEPERIGRRYPHQVSGGQLQRLMIAMAMICSPEILLLDEPTTALDVTTQVEILKAIKDIIRENQTRAVYITHDLSVVAQVADNIVVLRNGEVIEYGETAQILHRPRAEYSKLLIEAVRQLPSPDFFHTPLRETSCRKSFDQPLLEVRDVSASYDRRLWRKPTRRKLVLQDINITIGKGKTVAVVGESGCGKSTLARVIAGLLPPSNGGVLYHGERPFAPKLKDRDRSDLRRIQLVFQDPDSSLNPKQQIREILGRPLEFYLNISRKNNRDRVEELLNWVELPPNFAIRFPGELSGGERQRVSLARALSANPELILCDEVVSALDTIVGTAVLKLLERLQKRFGVSYLFISHDLATVANIADHVVVLYGGQVVEQGSKNQVFTPPYHPYSRLLLFSVPAMRQGWLEELVQTRTAKSAMGGVVTTVRAGCPFFNRCPLALPGTCEKQRPPKIPLPDNHCIYCHQEIELLMDRIL